MDEQVTAAIPHEREETTKRAMIKGVCQNGAVANRERSWPV